ncbi:transglutaminase-like domain-containing protein [Propionibacteriaceae bacterium G57]|uniref:transglutaminase-like domain-containing protein n=1 Tax=Aestuariimicrobium sp. G57 TaxID=3418485 RepID=UPI003DA79588
MPDALPPAHATPTTTVSASLDVAVTAPADIVFSIAVASGHRLVSESLTMTSTHQGGEATPVAFHEFVANPQVRLHRTPKAPVGLLQVRYQAEVGELLTPVPHGEPEEILYGRPSRYCDSDRLAQVAWNYFKGLQGTDLVKAVREWVNTHIAYTLGSSRVVDGALETYLSRKGVCRDMAHLTITFCRAMNIPARLVSVYAPGLTPMDFHAVAEMLVDGRWYMIDPTGLAPRQTMVRIATGRDASDTAFMTTIGGRTQLKSLKVTATSSADLPSDDGRELIELV